jgi:AcrR family transcriptional regulator
MVPKARRELLLGAAREVFHRRSYYEASIEEIARVAGASKGLLHHYFGGKRELYVAYLQDESKRMLSRITAITPRTPTIETLTASVEEFLRYVEDNPVGYSSLLQGGVGSDRKVNRIVGAARDRYVKYTLGIMAPGGATIAQEMAVRAWIGCIEAATLHWLHAGVPKRAALASFLVSAFPLLLTAAGRAAPR